MAYTSISQISLATVDTNVVTAMSSTEATLNSQLAAVQSMTSVGVADMIQIQYEMSNYTIAGQALSGVMKDMTDTFKNVIQKIG